MYNIINPTENTVAFSPLTTGQSEHEGKPTEMLRTTVGQTMFSEKLSVNKHSPKFQTLDCSSNKDSDNSHKPKLEIPGIGGKIAEVRMKPHIYLCFSLVKK